MRASHLRPRLGRLVLANALAALFAAGAVVSVHAQSMGTGAIGGETGSGNTTTGSDSSRAREPGGSSFGDGLPPRPGTGNSIRGTGGGSVASGRDPAGPAGSPAGPIGNPAGPASSSVGDSGLGATGGGSISSPGSDRGSFFGSDGSGPGSGTIGGSSR
jgi:hypothetical protein